MEKNYLVVDSVEKLEEAIARTREAQKKLMTYTQEQVDKIFLAAASAANKARTLQRWRLKKPAWVSKTRLSRITTLPSTLQCI